MIYTVRAKARGCNPLQAPAASLADASAAFAKWRDAAGIGGSDLQDARIIVGRKVVGHFSYNGRIWDKPSCDYRPGDRPLYSPF